MTTTPPLPATPIQKTTSRITFKMTPCDPLYIKTLIVTSDDLIQGAMGNVTPISQQNTHELSIGPTKFQDVYNRVSLNVPVKLLITYDNNYVVWDFNIFGLGVAVSSTTTVETVTVDPSTGRITDVIEQTVVTEA